MNRKIVLTAALSAILFSPVFTVQAAKVVNKTIATVNGESILLSEFEKNWSAFMEQQETVMPQDKMTDDWKKDARKKLMDQMVADKLLLQEAKKKKVRVGQRELENGIIQVKVRFLPEAAQKQMQEIVQKQLSKRPEDAPAPEAADIDLVSAWTEVSTANPAAAKEAEAKFKEELGKEGLDNKKFEDRIKDQLSVVALTSQEVRSRTKPPTDEETRKLFDQVKAVMQDKKVSGLSAEETADLQSMARFFAAQTGERVHARHILLLVPQDASFKEKSEIYQKMEKIKERIKKGEDFAKVAKQVSDDKGSAANGGDLGFFGRGQMVPAFEKAAFTLETGKTSDIVESNFGFHLIKVEEKKSPTELQLKDVENDLKEYIYRANAQKNFEGYVKELRAAAAVKLNVSPEELAQN